MRWQLFDNTKTERGQAITTPARNQDEEPIQCPLCGKRFRTGEADACSGCALAKRCGLVMCPNCSYEFSR